MLDLLERLRAKPPLQTLLAHYASLAASSDRQVWQDRLMTVDRVDASDLSRLHGELIAFDWIEQNTGHFGAYRAGAVTGCYRVTNAGLRALARLKATQDEEEAEGEESQAADPESSAPPVESTVAEPATEAIGLNDFSRAA
jgi:hypothetical protein